jgi:hypothetical protein
LCTFDLEQYSLTQGFLLYNTLTKCECAFPAGKYLMGVLDRRNGYIYIG